jgi:predicted amidohydrolase
MEFLSAAVQLLATSNKEANLRETETLLRKAREDGAKLIALPELFNWRGPKEEEGFYAETIPGPTSSLMAHLAKDLGVHILAGSILERVAGERRVYNTSLLFSPQGEILAKYRKIHLFDVDLTDGVRILESATRQPGKDVVVVETGLGRMGLTICYDLRFPELYRLLLDRGSQIIFVPSVFTEQTGKAHWEPLLRARAIENQVYIIAPDQTGRNQSGAAAYGCSMIVDPWGRVLARAPEGPGVINAKIDLGYLERVRNELPSSSHRKIL